MAITGRTLITSPKPVYWGGIRALTNAPAASQNREEIVDECPGKVENDAEEGST
jgi:hypothetical protein